MRSSKYPGIAEANFEIVFMNPIYPHGHGILGSFENLVICCDKYQRWNRETLQQQKEKKKESGKNNGGWILEKKYTVRKKDKRVKDSEREREEIK